MSQVCNETGESLCGPFLVMSAVIRDPESGKLAESDLEVSLSKDTVADRLQLQGTDCPEEIEGDIFYKIERAAGFVGGMTGTVQSCRGYTKYGADNVVPIPGMDKLQGNARYISLGTAQKSLPKSARFLLAKPDWVELVDGEYKPAEWAKRIR